MCNKATNAYCSTIRIIFEYFKTQEMLILVDTCVFVFHSVPQLYETKEMCDRVVSEESSMTIYWLYS